MGGEISGGELKYFTSLTRTLPCDSRIENRLDQKTQKMLKCAIDIAF